MGRPKLPPRHLSSRRLDEAGSAFLEYVRGRLSADSGTPAAKAVIIHAMVECLGADRQVWTLTAGDFESALTSIINGAGPAEAAQRRAEGRKPRTGRTTRGSIHAAATTLRQFAQFCHRHVWLDSDITLMKEIVQGRKNHLDGNADSAEALRVPRDQWPALLTLAEEIHMRCRMAVALGLHCGRRVSEVVHAQWRHIDWVEEEIRFYNKKRGGWVMAPVPLFPELRAEIDHWREWAEALHGPVRADWYLVPNRIANPGGVNSLCALRQRPWRWPVVMTEQSRTETVNKDVRKLLGQLGVGPNELTGTHTWRRSAAEFMAQRHGLREAQALLDHKSLVTTERYLGANSGRQLLRVALMGAPDSAPDNNVVPLRPVPHEQSAAG